MVKRVLRLLRRRLPIIVAAVLVGTIGAAWLTAYLNDQIRPTFQATAEVFIGGGSETGARSGEPDQTLTSAEEAAIEANAAFLDIRHGVRADPSTQSIQFIVSAPSEEQAMTEAADMRIRYMVATAPPPIEDQIQDVLAKAHFVRAELDDLLPPELVVESDPAEVSRYSVLSEQIRSLNSESAKLAVELVLADSESEKADIQADLDLILGQIVELREELESLPPEVADSATRGASSAEGDAGRTDVPDVAPSNIDLNDQFRIESLQSLYASLLTEFQTLYIRSIDGEVESLPDITVTDETRDPVAVPLGAGIGLAVALLLALSAILIIDRLRPRWWTAHELSAAMGEAPDRRHGEPSTWYWATGANPRKTSLQKAAVRLLPVVESGPAAIGLVGLGVRPQALRGLAYDLGAVIVTTGRRTLVVDTTGLVGTSKKDQEKDTREERMNGAITVGDLLNPWQNGANRERARQAVAHASELWPGLSVIPPGSPTLYSIEGAMTPVVSNLVAFARESFALTLVPVTDQGTALTDAFVRNLDAVVLVGSVGRTRLRAAEAALKDFVTSGTPVLGTLLLAKPRRRRLRELLARGQKSPTPTGSLEQDTQGVHSAAENGVGADAEHVDHVSNGAGPNDTVAGNGSSQRGDKKSRRRTVSPAAETADQPSEVLAGDVNAPVQ